MGLFNGLFGSSEGKGEKEERQLPWKKLTRIEQLDEIAEASKGRPQAIFKHSTTCGISRMVLRGMESQYDIDAGALDFYYLDLKAYRDISNEVATRFQVWHESPQIILIKNGIATYHDSHGAVTAEGLKEKL